MQAKGSRSGGTVVTIHVRHGKGLTSGPAQRAAILHDRCLTNIGRGTRYRRQIATGEYDWAAQHHGPISVLDIRFSGTASEPPIAGIAIEVDRAEPLHNVRSVTRLSLGSARNSPAQAEHPIFTSPGERPTRPRRAPSGRYAPLLPRSTPLTSPISPRHQDNRDSAC